MEYMDTISVSTFLPEVLGHVMNSLLALEVLNFHGQLFSEDKNIVTMCQLGFILI